MPDIAPQIAVELSFADLPEGWQGTAQDLLTWIGENAIFRASGSFLTGQIGGTRPTTNVGIFVNGSAIEVWKGSQETGSYVPLLTIPIGTVIDFAGYATTAPDNYLFCDGQLLNIADYPDLAAVLARTYSRADDDAATFRVPDLRGRVTTGGSDDAGEFNPLVPSGLLKRRQIGEYYGAEWVSPRESTQANAPTPRYQVLLAGSTSTNPPYAINSVYYMTVIQPSMGVRKLIRAK